MKPSEKYVSFYCCPSLVVVKSPDCEKFKILLDYWSLLLINLQFLMEKSQFRLVEYFGSSKVAKQRLALLTLLESSAVHDDSSNYTYYIINLLLKMKFDDKNINTISPVIPVLCYTLLKSVHFTKDIKESLDPDSTKNFMKHLKTILCSDDLKLIRNPVFRTLIPSFTSMIQQWCKEPSFRQSFRNTILPSLLQQSNVWSIDQIRIIESFCMEIAHLSCSGKGNDNEVMEILGLMLSRGLSYPLCLNIVLRCLHCVTFRNFRKRIKRIYEIGFPLKIDPFQQKVIDFLGKNRELWKRFVLMVGKLETSERYHAFRLLAYVSTFESTKLNKEEYRRMVLEEVFVPSLRDSHEDEVILECGLCTFLVLVGGDGWVGGKAYGPAMDQLVSTYAYLLKKKNVDVCKDLCILLHFVREKYVVCMQVLRHILSHYRLHRDDFKELRNGNLRLNELIQVLRVIIRESIRLRLKQLIRQENGIRMRRDYFTLLIREEAFKDLFSTSDEDVRLSGQVDDNKNAKNRKIASKNKKSKVSPQYIAKLRNVVVYCLFTEFLRQDPASGGDRLVIEAWYIVGLSILKWGTDFLLRPPIGYRSSLAAFGRVVVALLRYDGKVKESYYEMVSRKFIKDCLVRIYPQLIGGRRLSSQKEDGYLKTMLLVILSQWMGSFQTMGGKDSKSLFMSHLRHTLMPRLGRGRIGRGGRCSDYERKVSVDVLTGVLYRCAWRFSSLREEVMSILNQLMDSSENKIGPIYESYLMTYRKVKFLMNYEKMMDIKPEEVSDDHIVFSTSFFTSFDHEFYLNYLNDVRSIFDERKMRMSKSIVKGEYENRIKESCDEEESEDEGSGGTSKSRNVEVDEDNEIRQVISYPDDPLYVTVVKNWMNDKTLDLSFEVRNDGLSNLTNVRAHIMSKYENEKEEGGKSRGCPSQVMGGYGEGPLLWKMLRKGETKSVVVRVNILDGEEIRMDVLILVNDRFNIRCDSLTIKCGDHNR